MEYSILIKTACERVKKVKGINVYLSNIEFYGVHKYSYDNVYKIDLIVNNEPLTIYGEEEVFKSWADVP